MTLLFLDGPGSCLALQAKSVRAVKPPRPIDKLSDCVGRALVESIQSSFLRVVECLLCEFAIAVLGPSPILHSDDCKSTRKMNSIEFTYHLDWIKFTMELGQK